MSNQGTPPLYRVLRWQGRYWRKASEPLPKPEAEAVAARLKAGEVRYKKLSRQQYIVCLDDLGYTEAILDAEDKITEILDRRTE